MSDNPDNKHKALWDLNAQFRAAIDDLFETLKMGSITLEEWTAAMADLLAKYQSAAWLTGAEALELGNAEQVITDLVAEQVAYLEGFADDIAEWLKNGLLPGQELPEGEQAPGPQDPADLPDRFASRARSYSDSVIQPYWLGYTDDLPLPLPAMPGDGTTQCLTHDRCEWEIKIIDDAKGDYDCYWVMNPVAEHCQTCTERARAWNPLQIRDFAVIRRTQDLPGNRRPPRVSTVFTTASKRIAAKPGRAPGFQPAAKEASYKHLAGGHNQKRHGWRFGSLDRIRKGLRAGISEDYAGRTTPEAERLAYRKRAGLPEDLYRKQDEPPINPKFAGIKGGRNFEKWFKDSKVVNPDGSPKRMYHGTAAFGAFDAFDMSRMSSDSLYGPGVYFTENQEIASDYAKGGTAGVGAYGIPWLGAKVNGSNILSKADSDKLIDKLEAVNEEIKIKDPEEAGYRNINWLIRDLKAGHAFEQIDEEAFGTIWHKPTGRIIIDRLAKLIDYDYYSRALEQAISELGWDTESRDTGPGVMPVFLSIKNPIDMDSTDNAPMRKIIDIVAKKSGKDLPIHLKGQFYANNGGVYNLLYRWIVGNVKGISTDGQAKKYIMDVMKEAGFDGITHIGGQDKEGHRVWIAFAPGQIESVFNRGTWDASNPSVLKSLGWSYTVKHLDGEHRQEDHGHRGAQALDLPAGQAEVEAAVGRIQAGGLNYKQEQAISKYIKTLPAGTRVINHKGETGRLEHAFMDNGTSNRRTVKATRVVWDNPKKRPDPWNGTVYKYLDAVDPALSWYNKLASGELKIEAKKELSQRVGSSFYSALQAFRERRTFKHEGGGHDQKRHGWRYGAGAATPIENMEESLEYTRRFNRRHNPTESKEIHTARAAINQQRQALIETYLESDRVRKEMTEHVAKRNELQNRYNFLAADYVYYKNQFSNDDNIINRFDAWKKDNPNSYLTIDDFKQSRKIAQDMIEKLEKERDQVKAELDAHTDVKYMRDIMARDKELAQKIRDLQEDYLAKVRPDAEKIMAAGRQEGALIRSFVMREYKDRLGELNFLREDLEGARQRQRDYIDKLNKGDDRDQSFEDNIDQEIRIKKGIYNRATADTTERIVEMLYNEHPQPAKAPDPELTGPGGRGLIGSQAASSGSADLAKTTFKNGFDIFHRLINNPLIIGDLLPNVKISSDAGDGRASYTHEKRELLLDANHSTLFSTIHELTHHLEFMDPIIHDIAIKFFQRRVSPGEKSLELNYLEFCFADNFIDPYCGRIYLWGLTRDKMEKLTGGVLKGGAISLEATELISVGLETLTRDPIGFMVKDPDHFDLIYAITKL